VLQYALSYGAAALSDQAGTAIIETEWHAIVAELEYDYGGAQDPWNEAKKCFAYWRDALE
jgi:hypothetical protein